MRLFQRVLHETERPDDAMWAVLQAEQRWLKQEVMARRTFNAKAQSVVNEVCEMCNVQLSEFLGPGRMPHLVEARWIAMRALRDLHFSLPVIALHVGRHHTSVLNGLDSTAERPELLEAARDAIEASQREVRP